MPPDRTQEVAADRASGRDASIAQFYLDIYRRGVRPKLKPAHLEIQWPDDLPETRRDDVRARQEELHRYLLRLRGAGADPDDGRIMRDTMRALSRARFDRNRLVLIKPGDISRALFFPHSLSGSVVPSVRLSRFFAPDQAVFGFQAPGLNDEREPLRSVEDMAACYVAQMRIVNPHGPYYLCGWSLGGHIAFEMARQVHAAGGQVDLLAVLDSRLPAPTLSERERWLTFYRYAREAEETGRLEILDRAHPFWQLDETGRLEHILAALKASEKTRSKTITMESLKRHFAYLGAVCDAQASYLPRPYPGPITFLRAQDCPDGVVALWSGLTSGPFRVVEIPGGHLSLMEYHNRGVVLVKLVECLDEAQQDARAAGSP